MSTGEKAASDFAMENESLLPPTLIAKDSEMRQQEHALIRKANLVYL